MKLFNCFDGLSVLEQRNKNVLAERDASNESLLIKVSISFCITLVLSLLSISFHLIISIILYMTISN